MEATHFNTNRVPTPLINSTIIKPLKPQNTMTPEKTFTPKELIDQFEEQEEELRALLDGMLAFPYYDTDVDFAATWGGLEPKVTMQTLTGMAAKRISKMNECANLLYNLS
jgi:hypothetical protein